jgi:hypothetical protein
MEIAAKVTARYLFKAFKRWHPTIFDYLHEGSCRPFPPSPRSLSLYRKMKLPFRSRIKQTKEVLPPLRRGLFFSTPIPSLQMYPHFATVQFALSGKHSVRTVGLRATRQSLTVPCKAATHSSRGGRTLDRKKKM